jgi:hypothetical protein
MIERVIILCAGRGERWGNHKGVPKHLVPVGDEKLLDRTLRLVRMHTFAPITIVSFDKAYDRKHCERFEPPHGPVDFTDTDKFLSSQSRWAETGRTVVLLGDVFFTESAIATIFEFEGSYRFFGRREHSLFTGCPWRELFALTFPAKDQAKLLAGMQAVKAKLVSGDLKRGGGWELYEHLHQNDGSHFTTIDDFTDDFDFPHDYERWLKRYQNPVHRRLAPVFAPSLKNWKWRLERWSRSLNLR